MKNLIKATLASTILLLSAQPANAIDVSFEEDARLPIVHVNVAIRSGSVADPAGQSGLTNFMGDMLLRGTRQKTKEQIDLRLDELGASLNSITYSEMIVLQGSVLSSELPAYLDLLLEVLTRPTFPKREIKKLSDEYQSQLLASLSNDSALASKHFKRELFLNHPYANSKLGKRRDIKKFTSASLRKHYDSVVRQANIVIVGTGNTKGSVIVDWAKKLGATRRGDQTQPQVATPINHDRSKIVIVNKPDRTQTQIRIGHIGMSRLDKNFFPFQVANFAFGAGGFTSRLMQEIRVKRGWSYGAGSYLAHTSKPHSWRATLFPATKDTSSALKKTIDMITDFKADGITQEEFKFAKNSLIKSSAFDYDTPKKRAWNTLVEKMGNLPKGFMKSYASKLDDVTFAQANEAVKNFVKPENLVIVVLGTAKKIRAKIAKQMGVATSDISIVDYKKGN